MLTFVSENGIHNMGFIKAKTAEKREIRYFIKPIFFLTKQQKMTKIYKQLSANGLNGRTKKNELDFARKIWYAYKAAKKMLV
jgi:hypothetical protein